MELIPGDIQLIQLLLGDLDSCLVLLGVQSALHFQAFLGCRRTDQADDHSQRDKGPSPPVLAYVAEHAVLDFVPLGGARRKVGDMDLQPGLVGQMLQLLLPKLVPASIAPPAVGGDVEPGSPMVLEAAHLIPPGADAVRRKGRGVA